MEKRFKLLALLFTLGVMWGCNSEYADMSPLSGRRPFITQLGKFTQSPNGNNQGDEICADVVVDDKSETSYCVGGVNGSFGRISDGSRDVFIAKFDRRGKVLWVRQFGSSNAGNESCSSAGIDEAGNIYCGGVARGLMNPAPLRIDTLTPRTSTDIDPDALVLKVSPNGHLLWANQFGTSKEESCGNIAVSPKGSVYCGSRTNGALGDEVTGGLETHNEDLDGNGTDINNDSYIAKISSDGHLLWKRQIGANAYPDEADFTDNCGGVTIDHEENVICAGTTLGSLGEPNAGSNDIFIWSFTKDGNFRFLRQIGAQTDSDNPIIRNATNNDQSYDITTDSKGNLYLVGLTLGSLAATNQDGSQDPILLKFDKNGNLLDGAQAHFPGHQRIQAVVVNKNEEAILLGDTDTTAYGPLGGTFDIFVVHMKKNLTYKWYKQFGSDSGLDSDGIENATGIALDEVGNIYIGGSTDGNFGETNASNTSDIFMLRLSPGGRL